MCIPGWPFPIEHFDRTLANAKKTGNQKIILAKRCNTHSEQNSREEIKINDTKRARSRKIEIRKLINAVEC